MEQESEKLVRQKLLEIEQKKKQAPPMDDEWGDRRDIRHKIRVNHRKKHISRFTYDLEEEGD
jgi:hypothetical protein